MPYKDGEDWRGVVTKDGRRIKQKRFKLKRDAATWEREEKEALKKALKASQLGLVLLTICSKYALYSERYTEKVYNEKKNLCDRILKFWSPKTPVEDITAEMAEAYLLEQKEKRSANASNKDRKNLMAMWNKGIKTWGLTSNPFAATEKFAHDRIPQYTPAPEQVLAVIMAAERKDKVLLYAYIMTGARRSELFRWTWVEDINFEKRQYRLGSRKNRDGSMRHEWFPMQRDLFDELTWWWRHRTIKDSPYVFTDDQPGPHYGKPYKARRRFMAGLCMRAFDPKCKSHKEYSGPLFGFHALRRFCASCLADAGKSTNSIRRFLRHTNVRTTEIYIQNINDDMADVAEALSPEKIFSIPQSDTPKAKKGDSENR
jgi:integrase